MSTVLDSRLEVASVARMLARAGLIEAFGHVSARLEHRGFALTSTRPLLAASPNEVLELDEGGNVLGGNVLGGNVLGGNVLGGNVLRGNVLGGERCPLEAPLHAAVYRRRPDVGAICRTHSPYAAVWACRREAPPLVHGLGGLSGSVAVYGSAQLVCDDAAGEAAARALGESDCVLLAANGTVCTGPDLPRAAVRAWFLEERARIATLGGRDLPPLEGEPLLERSRHFEAESARAWSWIQARFGDAAGDGMSNCVQKEDL